MRYLRFSASELRLSPRSNALCTSATPRSIRSSSVMFSTFLPSPGSGLSSSSLSRLISSSPRLISAACASLPSSCSAL